MSRSNCRGATSACLRHLPVSIGLLDLMDAGGTAGQSKQSLIMLLCGTFKRLLPGHGKSLQAEMMEQRTTALPAGSRVAWAFLLVGVDHAGASAHSLCGLMTSTRILIDSCAGRKGADLASIITERVRSHLLVVRAAFSTCFLCLEGDRSFQAHATDCLAELHGIAHHLGIALQCFFVTPDKTQVSLHVNGMKTQQASSHSQKTLWSTRRRLD